MQLILVEAYQLLRDGLGLAAPWGSPTSSLTGTKGRPGQLPHRDHRRSPAPDLDAKTGQPLVDLILDEAESRRAPARWTVKSALDAARERPRASSGPDDVGHLRAGASVVPARPDDAACDWLPNGPHILDSLTGGQLAIARGMPVVCSEGFNSPAGLELMASAGLEPAPHRVHYRAGEELAALSGALSACDGKSRSSSMPFPTGPCRRTGSGSTPCCFAGGTTRSLAWRAGPGGQCLATRDGRPSRLFRGRRAAAADGDQGRVRPVERRRIGRRRVPHGRRLAGRRSVEDLPAARQSLSKRSSRSRAIRASTSP